MGQANEPVPVEEKIHKQRALMEMDLRGLRPGTPEFQAGRHDLMPIEVYLGYGFDTQNNPVPYNWQPGLENNGFMMVTGGSGSGKTEALKTIGVSIAEHGIPLITIDFHGDVIFPGQNTVRLSAGPDAVYGINPLQVEPDYIRRMGLRAKVSREVRRLSRAAGDMSEQQEACLHHVIEDVYHFYGIREDVESTWLFPTPTLKDVSQALLMGCEQGIAGFAKTTVRGCWSKLQRLSNNPVFVWGQSLRLKDMLDWNLRLDCSMLDPGSQLLVAETVLEMIFEDAKTKGPIPVNPSSDADRYRAFVMIDETRILTLGRGDLNSPEHILNIMASQCRKFGIGLILASQMSSHFSREVHVNISSRIAMKRMDPYEAKKVAPQMGLSPNDLISNESQPGTGYFRSASTNGTVLLRLGRVSA